MTLSKYKRLTQAAALILLGSVSTLFSAHAKPYKGAEIFTFEENLYGKYVIRMQAAKGSGIISNFFLWKDGSELSEVFWEEVDVEVFGKDNATSWQSNIITGLGERKTSEGVHQNNRSFGDAYHTFALEWSPDKLEWFVDGQLIRSESGGQTRELMNPAQLRLNFWPPNIPSWVGNWNDGILPVHMFVNWVEYHRWTGSGYELAWRDDFNNFDENRWGKADWTFDENRADFSPTNASVRNGYLILSMTREGQEGYNGNPPNDNQASSSSSAPSSSSSLSSSSSSESRSSSSSSSVSSSSQASSQAPTSTGGALNGVNLFLILLLLFAGRSVKRYTNH